ncbi:MAG: polysaccharide deacetylase family protein [Janthinobacterium lividum]
MYHALVEHPAPYLAAVHIEWARFAEQMAWLAASGLRVRPLAEALAALRQPGGAGPAPLVALTFDDGYHSLYTHARPILAQYGFAASLFLTVGAVGQPSYDGEPAEFARSAPRGDRPLTWAELRELQATGWAIEAHGCTHRPLAGLAPADVAQELSQSRAAIAHQLGQEAQYYAFPYGSYDRRTLRALAGAGYAAGLSVHTGPATPASDWRRLPRLEVTAGCDLATFQQLVRTGYASPGAHYRARLRDWAYRVPAVHDALLAVPKKLRGLRS